MSLTFLTVAYNAPFNDINSDRERKAEEKNKESGEIAGEEVPSKEPKNK